MKYVVNTIWEHENQIEGCQMVQTSSNFYLEVFSISSNSMMNEQSYYLFLLRGGGFELFKWKTEANEKLKHLVEWICWMFSSQYVAPHMSSCLSHAWSVLCRCMHHLPTVEIKVVEKIQGHDRFSKNVLWNFSCYPISNDC